MVSRLGVPVIVPSPGSLTRHPFPSTGSPGVGSPASSVPWSAPTPGRPSRRASFPSLGGTVRALDLRSRDGERAVPRPGLFNRGPRPALSHGDDQASQVPEEPSCVHAPLSDPGELFTPGLLGVSMRPSVRLTTSALAGINLSRLNHAACTLPVYASQRGSLRHHATLGAGWWPTFAGRDWVPAGLHRKVSEIAITSLPPFPGFAWRTSRDYGESLPIPVYQTLAPCPPGSRGADNARRTRHDALGGGEACSRPGGA